MSKQSVRVQIFNQSYTLLADGDPAEVATVAQEIDELMASIASRAGTGDTTRVAVLACLHLADKLRSTEAQLRSIETKSSRIAQLLERALDDAQFENV
jgi:cell division protein ZapA